MIGFDFVSIDQIPRSVQRLLEAELNSSYIRHLSTHSLGFPSMSHTTPDNLLKLAADLNKLGRELCATGGKLAQAATTLEQEAANVALANAHRWGVDVQVCDTLDLIISVTDLSNNIIS